MKLGYAPLIALALLAAGCATTTTPATAAGAPSSAASASALAASPSAPAPSPSAPAPPCTTHACIITDIRQSLVGTAAKDGSVITAITCRSSSVKHNAGNTFTATCDVTYSDGTVYNGYANVLPAANQVTFQPEYEVS